MKLNSPQGGITTSIAVESIAYAAAQGAKVINASWGDYGFDPALEDAIQLAGQSGTVFVAAAGNHSNDNDNPQHAYYPASFTLPNLIGVASVGPSGTLSGFSNYGNSTIELGAPGESILSTWTGGGYALTEPARRWRLPTSRASSPCWPGSIPRNRPRGWSTGCSRR